MSFTTPPSLGIYDAGASVPVQVSARLGDGGAFVVTVPLTSSSGTNTSVTSGVSTPLSLPAIAGTYRLTAGWDGGPGDTVSVLATSCVASCQPWQSCRATTDGGVCDSLNLTLTWTSPDAGLPFNTASVPARLSVTRSGGAVPASLTSVPLFGPLGVATPLSGGSGVFTGTLPMAAPEGNKTFVAGWPDGGPTASVTIERDTVAPGVVLETLPRPFSRPDPDPRVADAWKKNESALVRATVDGGRPVSAADLTVVDSGVVIVPAAAASCGCTSLTCSCFEVPLLRAAEYRVRGNVIVAYLQSGPIADNAGNQSARAEAEINVSRFLWSRPTAGATKLALSESGLLLVSSGDGSTIALTGIAPDGGTQWSWSSSSQRISRPVVGSSLAYVAVQEYDGTSSIKAVSLGSGTVSSTLCEANEGDPFREPFALATTITGTEIPLAFRKGFILAATGSCPTSPQYDAMSFGSIATQREPGGGLGAYFIADNALRKLVFTGLAFEDGGVGGPPNPADLWLGPGTVWWVNGQSALYVAATNAFPATISSIFVAGFGSLPPMFGSGAAWFVSPSSIARCGYDTTFVFDPNCAQTGFAQPLSTQPSAAVRTVGGFVANPGGFLYDLREDGGISRAYGAAQTSELITDAPRSPTGAKACGAGLGIAYVTDLGGNVVAWLIDAQGLDGTAYWPRARHDNANSGNFNRSLAPWSCP